MAKRKKGITLKEKAKRHLQSLGWECADVEKWIPRTNIRKDLFGIADLLAVKGSKTLAVQVSAEGDVAIHVDKMMGVPQLWDCLAAKWMVEVWGVRRTPVRDGSFAVVRYFELDKRGNVTPYDGSLVLK